MLRWRAEQLKKLIAMLSDPEFDSKDLDPDLHKRMEKAVEDVLIRCFNMREGTADGNQDLNFWLHELETARKKGAACVEQEQAGSGDSPALDSG
jgi:hypothetical protein